MTKLKDLGVLPDEKDLICMDASIGFNIQQMKQYNRNIGHNQALEEIGNIDLKTLLDRVEVDEKEAKKIFLSRLRSSGIGEKNLAQLSILVISPIVSTLSANLYKFIKGVKR